MTNSNERRNSNNLQTLNHYLIIISVYKIKRIVFKIIRRLFLRNRMKVNFKCLFIKYMISFTSRFVFKIGLSSIGFFKVLNFLSTRII